MDHSRKRRYPTEDDVISAILRASTRTGQPFRPYYCAPCDGWHMTSWVTTRPESNRGVSSGPE